MSAKTLGLLGIILATVIGVVWWTFLHHPSNNENHPAGTYWMCKNKSCGNTFHLTMAELGDWHKNHYGHRPQCPKCGEENTVQAMKCQNCGKISEYTRNIQPCPYCHAMPS